MQKTNTSTALIAFAVICTALPLVAAGDRGISRDGGYFDGNTNRWITSYKSDIEGYPVEEPATMSDDGWGTNFVNSFFQYPKYEQHSAMCRQMDSLQLGRGQTSRPMRSQEMAMRPQRPPPLNMRSQSINDGHGRPPATSFNDERPYRGTGPPPARANLVRSYTMDPTMAAAPLRPVRVRQPMMDGYGDQYAPPPPRVRHRVPSPQQMPFGEGGSEISDHDGDLLPRRRRGPIPAMQGDRPQVRPMPPSQASQMPFDEYAEESQPAYPSIGRSAVARNRHH